ncbi:prepilin peptidase [Burkholderia vietnamiensis]|uniref:Peptidase A24A, prepilin type IV n=3 Tax=Burkholderia vietnamiensis TaxID=60552 RepID=A4JSX1_BURVG|nr:prepilin peptidase [Burkholderia vietnamiensis]ABO59374.1 peptidase A24A, prepilin type IV [Burkholderia vietnamiensis G4]KKI37836.1 peptidase A24 [Burkholderia vietnamiensis]KVD99386.1 peptidase A24 [Burkholderia vietnamiensis]KVE13534.1 peptidase A24 [Burkholderia vietnamiensis]KVE30849.1 peptidase A24 [Burkholderia vietnamiensis]
MLPVAPPYPVPLCVTLLVIVAASTDLASRRIPNRLVVAGLAGALVAQCALHGVPAGVLAWLAGAATGLGLLLPFYLLRGMAAGDVKLMLAIGAWVGAQMTFYIVLATFVAGGIGALGFALLRGRMRRMWTNVWMLVAHRAAAPLAGATDGPVESASVGALPYGVAIAVGTLGMLFASCA